LTEHVFPAVAKVMQVESLQGTGVKTSLLYYYSTSSINAYITVSENQGSSIGQLADSGTFLKAATKLWTE
jgi:hypothetical protein